MTLKERRRQMTQSEAYERFRALHEGPGMLVMPNAWDGTSAGLLARAGFQAIGSTSAAIAWALGRQDGLGRVSRDEAIANAGLLGDVSGLPINGDLEDGFGFDPEECAATVEASIAAGLAGLGIEDTTANPDQPIHDFDHAVARIAAAAKAAKGRILLTGRTDVLLYGQGDLDEAIRRLVAFAEAGADVLYVTGVGSIEDVRKVVAAVAPKPVNMHAAASISIESMATAGVRRMSLGMSLYRAAMAGLASAAESLAKGDIGPAMTGVPTSEIMALFPR
jgi:2-methylisocitrate lyase-like PEP mutase family enzyme